MRHLAGIVLAAVAAVVIFFAGGWGYLKLLRAPAGALAAGLPAGGGSLLHSYNVLAALGALLAVGLVVGLLVAIGWVSPLAAGLPGLALLALTGFYLTSVRRAVRLIPLKTHIYGQGFEAMLFNGVLTLVGLVMVIPLFVPSRWRRRTVSSVAPVGPSTGLLAEDCEAPTQQGVLPASFFPPQDQHTSPFPPQNPHASPTIIQGPLPPAGPGSAGSTGGEPFPPAQENPFPSR
jgi:hypothetical protein